MNKKMSEKMMAALKAADGIGYKKIDAELSRNRDKSIRDKYNNEKEIVGTRAWAIRMVIGMFSADYDDATCDKIISALK